MAKRRYTAEEIVTVLRQVEVAIANGKTGQVMVWLEFTYRQFFLKKDAKPDPQSILPQTVLRGVIFLQCDRNGKKDCSIEAMRIDEAGISWGLLPSTRGGNSSAGG